MQENQRCNHVNDPWYIPGKPDFGAPNCPVRALRYYHRYMTEHSELRRADTACLFHSRTTVWGRSSVQPLSLVGSARVSQERSKLMRPVLRLLHYNKKNFQQIDLQAIMKARRCFSGGTFVSFYLRDLCPQADSIQKTRPVVVTGEVIEISS